MKFNKKGKTKQVTKLVSTSLLIVSAVFFVFIVLLTGCASSSEPSAFSQDPPQDSEENLSKQQSSGSGDLASESTETMEPATLSANTEGDFVADGIINNDEYSGYKNLESVEIYWSNDSENIYIAIKAETEGFVAIGLQPGKAMKDADMILGFIDGGIVTIYDMFSAGSFGPHKPDIELGGTDDILDFDGNDSGGFTVLEFSRKLITDDKYDTDITPGVNKLIWAVGQSDNPDDKHISRGYGEIEFK